MNTYGSRANDLVRELQDLSSRAAQITDHIVRAANAHDAATIQDLTPELATLEQQIDLTSFKLACLQEAGVSIE